MVTAKLLNLTWPELSRAITDLPAKDTLLLLKMEAEGQARPYIMRRLYQSWRRRMNAADVQQLSQGKLPKWLLATSL